MEPRELFQQVSERMGLKWGITFEANRDDNTCRCTCDPKRKVHLITVDPETERDILSARLDKSEGRLTLVHHEIAHCWAAENISEAFSTMYLARVPERPEIGQIIYLAWSHVDIWINEIRACFYPHDAKSEDGQHWLDFQPLVGCNNCASAQLVQIVSMCRVEAKRHELNAPCSWHELLRGFTPEAAKVIERITTHLMGLPRLSCLPGKVITDRMIRKDLAMLGKSVTRMGEILGFPIRPKMITGDGSVLWDWDETI